MQRTAQFCTAQLPSLAHENFGDRFSVLFPVGETKMKDAKANLPPEFEFNPKDWKWLLDELGEKEPFYCRIVCSPIDILAIEDIRDEASLRKLPHKSTDIFLFSLGEPSRRDVTKIGGAPYRPARLPWPANAQNEPLTFLAQFRFTESRELVPNVPGDILLIFVDNEPFRHDPSYFHFEWYHLGISDLICAVDAPPPAWTFVTCFGSRYRTVDFFNLTRVMQLLEKGRPSITLLEASKIAWLDGMKIGGISSSNNLQEDWVRETANLTFLCSLSTIVPWPFGRYPWLNQPRPIAGGIPRTTEILSICDSFTFYLFVTKEMEIVPFVQIW